MKALFLICATAIAIALIKYGAEALEVKWQLDVVRQRHMLDLFQREHTRPSFEWPPKIDKNKSGEERDL